MRRALVALALGFVAAEASAHEGQPGHDHGLDDGDPTEQPPPAAIEEEVAATSVESESLPTEAAVPPPAPDPRIPQPPPDEESYGRTEAFGDTTWRKRVRDAEPERDEGWFRPAHFLIELRFGPYSPQVDEEPGLTGTPYADYFGTSPIFYFGLELDWLPLYIPYVASVGPAFGWGYTSASGNTRLVSNPAKTAESETSLTIFPMHLSAAVRFDGLLREAHVPIVPYGKVGFGWGFWSVSAPDDNTVDGVIAEGTSTGLHAAVGGAIALNAFDRSTAMAMRETTGISYAYLFGEWMGDFLGSMGGSGQMYVGTSTVVVGLAADF
jgi:hypothetical protein